MGFIRITIVPIKLDYIHAYTSNCNINSISNIESSMTIKHVGIAFFSYFLTLVAVLPIKDKHGGMGHKGVNFPYFFLYKFRIPSLPQYYLPKKSQRFIGPMGKEKKCIKNIVQQYGLGSGQKNDHETDFAVKADA